MKVVTPFNNSNTERCCVKEEKKYAAVTTWIQEHHIEGIYAAAFMRKWVQ
jgi:hypothetical protein